jgi:hypothetical protein
MAVFRHKRKLYPDAHAHKACAIAFDAGALDAWKSSTYKCTAEFQTRDAAIAFGNSIAHTYEAHVADRAPLITWWRPRRRRA